MANRVPVAIVRAAEKCGTAWDQSRAVVQRWLEDGGDPNQDLHEDGGFIYNFRLLLVAASSGRTDVVRLLLEHGADINHTFHYPDGYVDPMTGPMTALVLAADNLDLTRLLLDNGPEDVRICVKALSRPRLVRMLLVAGADVSARSCRGETPETWLQSIGIGERYVFFRESRRCCTSSRARASPVPTRILYCCHSRSCFVFVLSSRAAALVSARRRPKQSRASSEGAPLGAHARRRAATDRRPTGHRACPTPSSGR